MTHDLLRIRVVTPMAIAGASHMGTTRDLDVRTDRHGLPYIPRSRVMRRLKDGLLDVVTASADPDLAEASLSLFGASGETDPRPRLLRVGDALLPLALRQSIAEVLYNAPYQATATELIHAVTEALTVEEYFTKFRRDGAPEDNTLRSERLLAPGVELSAILSWSRQPDPNELGLAAAAVLCTNQLGKGQTDGLGRVDLALSSSLATDFADDRETTRELAQVLISGRGSATS